MLTELEDPRIAILHLRHLECATSSHRIHLFALNDGPFHKAQAKSTKDDIAKPVANALIASTAGGAFEVTESGRAVVAAEQSIWFSSEDGDKPFLRDSAPARINICNSTMATKSISAGKLAASARAALRLGLEQSSPSVIIDDKGYVALASDNLIRGVDLSDVESDFQQGDGNELKGKFRAAHSSSALAANTFGPFKRQPAELTLATASQFSSVHFERKCPHGLLNRRSPNLDVLADGQAAIVGIESKCLEFLSPHSAAFADAYDAQIRDSRRDGPWFAHMQHLQASPDSYRWLDAAQLVKHSFGLAHTFPDRRLVLLYLFWEPSNTGAHAHFAEHRSEITRFAQAVDGGSPAFAAMSYPELWRAWEAQSSPEWLATHVDRLRSRYDVSV